MKYYLFQKNLSKNNRILKPQIEQHYKKLVEYHLENKLDLPQVFIDLFATWPNWREVPLESLLPSYYGNILREHD